MTNLQEYLAGTSPTDPRNVLAIIHAGPSGNDFTITFTSVAGKLYDAERNDDLMNPTGWSAVQTNIPGTGGIIPVTDPGATAFPNRFYRVRLVPSP